jgi:hypothetical protein
MVSNEIPQKHTSGAKALINIASLSPGINPRPTARTIFQQAVKQCPFKASHFSADQSGSIKFDPAGGSKS